MKEYLNGVRVIDIEMYATNRKMVLYNELNFIETYIIHPQIQSP